MALFALSIYWDLPVLLVVVSLVYAATRRSFALLRPSTEDRSTQEAIRECILDAYSRIEAAS